MVTGIAEIFAGLGLVMEAPFVGLPMIIHGMASSISAALSVVVGLVTDTFTTIYNVIKGTIDMAISILETAIKSVVGLTKSLLGFNQAGNQTTSVLQQWLWYAGALVGMGSALGAITFGTKLASEAEQAEVSFTGLMKSADKAKHFLKDLFDFAAATPFEFPQLKTAAKSLMSAGFAAKDVIPMMRTIGDVTSAMGTGAEGVQRATYALMQMRNVGRIMGDDMRQLQNAGIPAQQILSKALGKTGEQIHKLAQEGHLGQKEMELFFAALKSGKGLEDFAGGMEKQSKTLQGLFSTLKDVTGGTLTKIMTDVIEALKIKDLLVYITDTMQKYTQVVIDSVKNLIKFVTPYAKELWGWLTNDGGIYATVASIIVLLQMLWGPILTTMGFLAGMFSPFLITGALVTQLLAKMVKDLGGFANTWKYLKPIVIQTWNTIVVAVRQIQAVGSKAFQSLWSLIQKTFKGILGDTISTWESVRDTILDALIWVEVGFNNLESVIGVIWENVKYQAVAAFEMIIYYIDVALPIGLNQLSARFKALWNWFVDSAIAAFHDVTVLLIALQYSWPLLLTGMLTFDDLYKSASKFFADVPEMAQVAGSKLPERVIKPLEEALGKSSKQMTENLGKDLHKQFDALSKTRKLELLKIVPPDLAKIIDPLGDYSKDLGRTLSQATGDLKKANPFDAIKAGGNEAYKFIAEYAQGTGRQGTQTPQAATAKNTDEIKKNSKKTVTILERINDTLDRMNEKESFVLNNGINLSTVGSV